MIVIHHNDLDGECAAAIANRWSSENLAREGGSEAVTFIEMDYKKPSPIDQIPEGEMVVILDFSFQPEDMKKILKKTENVVWCDHHATAQAFGYDLPGERDFSPKGLSGCELAWKYFFPGAPTPEAVVLLGDYDAWRLNRAPISLQFNEGMKMEDHRPQSQIWDSLFRGSTKINDIVGNGRIAIAYRDAYCKALREHHSYETVLDGKTACVLNVAEFGSAAFGDQLQAYPMCIAFIYDGDQYTVSLYSETIDVSVIAKKHGGGGHKGASGFVCDKLPFKPVGEGGK
jgi:oligoribonuclease NrnB/cAMP/cGMP phosphodiesterase (DHH superfamily)